MKDVTSAKGLSELRTATTHHIACKQPQKGTTHLDLYLLSMERQRLRKELSLIEKRQKRIQDRLGEIEKAMRKMIEEVQGEWTVQSPAAKLAEVKQASLQQHTGAQWKKMPVEY